MLALKIGFILAGLCFLFNPHVNIIDILPDAIGFGLILYGILPLSRVESHMSDAARRFRYLFITQLCKLPALYVLILVSGDDEQLFILLATMLFASLEIFFGFGAWNALFESFEKIGNTVSHTYVFGKLKQTRIFILVFTVLKPVMAILPDLTLLDNGQYGEVTADGIFSFQQFRGIFTVFSVALVLIVGIVWLILTLRYFAGIRKEKEFLQTVSELSATYYLEEKKVSYRRVMTALSFLSFAFLFCFELKIEGYSVLPPMIGGALLLIFFFLMRKEAGKIAKMGLIFSGVYFVTSLVGWILQLRFASVYYNENVGGGFSDVIYYQINNYFEAFDRLILITVVVFFSQLALAGVFVSAFLVLKGIASRYTGAPTSLVSEKDKTEAMRANEIATDLAAKHAAFAPLPFLLVSGCITAEMASVFPLVQIYWPDYFTMDLVQRVIFVVSSFLIVGKLKQHVKIKSGTDFE